MEVFADALRITKYQKNELSDAIKNVLSDAFLDDDNKISMKWIIGEIFDKSLNVTVSTQSTLSNSVLNRQISYNHFKSCDLNSDLCWQ